MGARAIKRVATALITDSLGAEPPAEPGPPEGRSHEASERASPGDSQVFTADRPSGERAGGSSYQPPWRETSLGDHRSGQGSIAVSEIARLTLPLGFRPRPVCLTELC